MPEIPREVLEAIATRILTTQLEDVEYLTVTEMTDDYFYDRLPDLIHIYESDDEALWRKVDDLVRKAKITIKFPED